MISAISKIIGTDHPDHGLPDANVSPKTNFSNVPNPSSTTPRQTEVEIDNNTYDGTVAPATTTMKTTSAATTTTSPTIIESGSGDSDGSGSGDFDGSGSGDDEDYRTTI